MHLASGKRKFPKFRSDRVSETPACVFSGVIWLHVDDMLGTGDELFESKLKELDKLVGFGSMKRQKFDQCGRQYEERTCR